MKFVEWTVKRYESVVVEFEAVEDAQAYRAEMRQKGYTEKDLSSVYGNHVCFLFAKLTACDLIHDGKEVHACE